MAQKTKRTVTSRFFAEKKPLSTHDLSVLSPLLPPNWTMRGRLTHTGTWQKVDITAAELAATINQGSSDTLFFPDTNFFTAPIDPRVWEALLSKHIIITPAVWNELKDWRATPFQNQWVRDVVRQAEGRQSISTQYVDELLFPIRQTLHLQCYRRIEILTIVDRSYKNHAYDYYFRLLALRKWMGPVAVEMLKTKLGREPTEDEFLAEVQGQYGERGYLLAKKGRDNESSPNLLTDEQFVVMAVQTAIMRGKAAVILTRDADVLEQYFKLLAHMKEHYRCMHAAERYAANPTSMHFTPTPMSEEEKEKSFFESDTVLAYQTTEIEFDVLPNVIHPVDICCLLVGGKDDLRMTFDHFAAEAEMVSLLRMKRRTGGLNTDKFAGRNCHIETAPFTPDNHRVTVYVGKEKRIRLGPFEFSLADANHTMFSGEKKTAIELPRR